MCLWTSLYGSYFSIIETLKCLTIFFCIQINPIFIKQIYDALTKRIRNDIVNIHHINWTLPTFIILIHTHIYMIKKSHISTIYVCIMLTKTKKCQKGLVLHLSLTQIIEKWERPIAPCPFSHHSNHVENAFHLGKLMEKKYGIEKLIFRFWFFIISLLSLPNKFIL